MKNRDRIIAVLIGILGGYYLEFIISLDRVLYYFLPEMPDRHLPRFYGNLLAAILGGYIACLLYGLIKEKVGKKRLFVSSMVTLVTIVLIISSYGVHTRLMWESVKNGEPDSIRFRVDNHVMFVQDFSDGYSGSGFSTYVEVYDDNAYKGEMTGILKDIKKDRIEEIKDYEKYEGDITFFMDYTVLGNWYSRIMSYSQYGLSERVGPNDEKIVIYNKNTELDNIINKVMNISKDIDAITLVKIVDYKGFWEDKMIEIDGSNLINFKESLKNMEIITLSNEDVFRYRDYFEDGIREGEEGIYAIEYSSINNKKEDYRFQRALLYDSKNNILVYSKEGPYYNINLDEYINK